MACHPAPDGSPCSGGDGSPCVVSVVNPGSIIYECDDLIGSTEFSQDPIVLPEQLDVYLNSVSGIYNVQFLITAIDFKDISALEIHPDPGTPGEFLTEIPFIGIGGEEYKLSVRLTDEVEKTVGEWIHYKFIAPDIVGVVLVDGPKVLVDTDGTTIIIDD